MVDIYTYSKLANRFCRGKECLAASDCLPKFFSQAALGFDLRVMGKADPSSCALLNRGNISNTKFAIPVAGTGDCGFTQTENQTE